jgi:peptide/nickel transport system substrate-binding protein
LVNEWKQLGINITLETVQKSLLLEQMSKSQALFFRGSWIADYPDPSNFMDVFYGGNPAPPNYTRFHHPVFDDLYEKSNRETDMGKRNQLFYQMEHILLEECPVIPLWYDMIVRFVDPAITGFYPNAMNMLELKTVKKNQSN